MKKVKFIIFAVIVIGFIVWAMLYQSGTIGGGVKVSPGEKNENQVGNDTEWSVITESVIPVMYSAVGTVRSREEIDIISRLITARVIQVNFRSGESFRENDILIHLEDKDLQAKVEAAKENLKGAESRLAFAVEEHARYAKLVESNAVSRRTYEESVSNLNSAKAQVAMMKHELSNAETNLDYATIRAPFDGIVAERNCDPGDLATPLNPLMKIFNPAKLQLRVPVRENLFAKIKQGDKLLVAVESTGKTYPAEVREIIPAVDTGSRTFLVNACLSGETKDLMPGMFATCAIPVGEKKMLSVSPDAIMKIGQLEYLYTCSPEGKQVKTLIKTAPLPGTDRREIISGAQVGMKYKEK